MVEDKLNSKLLEIIRRGEAVYMADRPQLVLLMSDQYQKTKRCDYTTGKGKTTIRLDIEIVSSQIEHANEYMKIIVEF